MSLGRMRDPARAGHPVALGAVFLALFPAGELLPQEPPGPPCPPPLELRVCQDTYSQPLGRIYLYWGNEASYDAHCIYVKNHLEAELPGEADIISIPGLSSGLHEFALKTICLSRSAERKVSFTVLDASPYPQPVKSMTCGFDIDRKAFTATFEGLAAPFVGVDVFKQEMNERPRYAGFTPLDPEDPTVTVEDVRIGATQVFFQFFDAAGYGSVVVGCPGDCHPPIDIQVHQDTFGDTGSVFLTWVRDGGQRGFEVSVNGARVGLAGALSEFHHLQRLEVDKPLTFEVKALCWGTEQPQSSELPTVFTLSGTSSNTRPIREMASTFLPDLAMSCVGPERGKIEVVWDPGVGSQDTVDILLRRGSLPLRYVTTIDGTLTAFTLDEAFSGDALFLQFFDKNGFGSPLQGTSFRRGDANHNGELDISDGVTVLDFLFLGNATIPCSDAGDSNDDGDLDVSDGLAILNFLFLGYEAPPEPGHLSCGQDPTPDNLPLCEDNCPGGSLP